MIFNVHMPVPVHSVNMNLHFQKKKNYLFYLELSVQYSIKLLT